MNPDYNQQDYNRRSNSMLWLTVVAVSLVALIGAVAYILGNNQTGPNDTGVAPGVGGGPGQTTAPISSPTPAASPAVSPEVSPSPIPTQVPEL